jgi:hypothetical protein
MILNLNEISLNAQFQKRDMLRNTNLKATPSKSKHCDKHNILAFHIQRVMNEPLSLSKFKTKPDEVYKPDP